MSAPTLAQRQNPTISTLRFVQVAGLLLEPAVIEQTLDLLRIEPRGLGVKRACTAGVGYSGKCCCFAIVLRGFLILLRVHQRRASLAGLGGGHAQIDGLCDLALLDEFDRPGRFRVAGCGLLEKLCERGDQVLFLSRCSRLPGVGLDECFGQCRRLLLVLLQLGGYFGELLFLPVQRRLRCRLAPSGTPPPRR